MVSADVVEARAAGESPERYVCRVALDKARAAVGVLRPDWSRPVLAADTAVVLDGQCLGKPANRQDALALLGQLSGRTHRVLSGIALVAADGSEATALSESLVRFRAIGRDEAIAYWDTGEPTDKAGGYGIQGIGALFVADLRGSYSGVMGLPLFETACLLEQAGISVLPLAAARLSSQKVSE